MYRSQLLAFLLLGGVAPGSECRVSTGPNGVCAALRLEPRRVDMTVGSTFQLRVTGLDCVSGRDCVDCANRRVRVRWRSSAPGIATVDSTGVVRAEGSGLVEIRLESEDEGNRSLGQHAGGRQAVAHEHERGI